ERRAAPRLRSWSQGSPGPAVTSVAGGVAEDDLVDEPFYRRQVVGEHLGVIGGRAQTARAIYQNGVSDRSDQRLSGQARVEHDVVDRGRLLRPIDQRVVEARHVNQVDARED